MATATAYDVEQSDDNGVTWKIVGSVTTCATACTIDVKEPTTGRPQWRITSKNAGGADAGHDVLRHLRHLCVPASGGGRPGREAVTRTLSPLDTMVIASGETTSNAVRGLENALAVWIWGPAALTGTITVEVEPTIAGSGFGTLQSGGSDVAIAAGKVLSLSPVAALQIRVKSTGAEGATRTFNVLKRYPA